MRHARHARRAPAGPAVLAAVAALAAVVTVVVMAGPAFTAAGRAAAGNAAVRAPAVDVQVVPGQQTVGRGRSVNYAVTVVGRGGFAGEVTLGAGALPAGITASLPLPTVRVSPSAPPVTVTLRLSASTSARTGSSTVQVRATGRGDTGGTVADTATARLTVTAALAGSFTLAAGPPAVTVVRGGSGTTTVTIARSSFPSPVALAVTGLPGGASAAFGQNPSGGPATTLTVSAGPRTPTGTWSLAITGGAAGRTSTTALQLTVQEPRPLTVAGDVAGPLAPGLPARPVDLVLGNPNPVAVDVRALTVAVTGTSAGARCDASNFAVRQYGGSYPLRLAAGATATLGALGVPAERRPHVQFLDKAAVNQDACKGVTVFLTYSGTAGGS
jgi:hypothetical protein